MNKYDKLDLYNRGKNSIENLTKAGVVARRRISFNDIIYFETQNLIERFLKNNQQKALPAGTINRVQETENAHQKFVKSVAVNRNGTEEQKAQDEVVRKQEELENEQNNDEMEIAQ